MKSIFIVFNQTHTEKVEYVMDQMGVRGYTQFNELRGRGSVNGSPHMGTHTWPEINNAVITMVEDELVEPLLEMVRKIDRTNEDVGIRAFVWNIEAVV